jgi:hypothetical protein
MQEFGKPSNEFARVEFRDDGRYELTCSAGHTTTTILQQQKFEVLFEIGAYAILDGYYREAVSSFSTSLERFYEFVVRVFLESISKADTLFQDCWKKVASQSERQLGAFIFLWAYHFNEPPALLSNSQVSFRNDVVHKGKIPTRDEAVKYGNSVLDILRPMLAALRCRFPEEVQKVTFYHLRDCRSESDDGRAVSTMSILTIVNIASGDVTHQKKALSEYLVHLAEWKRLAGGAES